MKITPRKINLKEWYGKFHQILGNKWDKYLFTYQSHIEFLYDSGLSPDKAAKRFDGILNMNTTKPFKVKKQKNKFIQ